MRFCEACAACSAFTCSSITVLIFCAPAVWALTVCAMATATHNAAIAAAGA